MLHGRLTNILPEVALLDAETQLEQYSLLVDEELRRVVSSRNLPLYSMMEHQLGWPSEHEPPARPVTRKLGALCLTVCASGDGPVESALPTAAAIELVQNFCEIHDDIQSGKVVRNGRDSVWWKWGPAQAINAGDGMHALARMALLGLLELGFTPETVFESVRILDKASLATCEGRFMDLEAQERLDVSSDSYLKMASAKTGSMFACAAEFGALVSAADPVLRSQFAEVGRSLGVAFQIADDLRQISQGADGEGPPSEDLMNKRKLFPVVRAFEMADPHQRRRLGDFYFKRVLEPRDVKDLAELVDSLGGASEARSQIDGLLTQARERLAAVLGDDDRSGSTASLLLDLVDVP